MPVGDFGRVAGTGDVGLFMCVVPLRFGAVAVCGMEPPAGLGRHPEGAAPVSDDKFPVPYPN